MDGDVSAMDLEAVSLCYSSTLELWTAVGLVTRTGVACPSLDLTSVQHVLNKA